MSMKFDIGDIIQDNFSYSEPFKGSIYLIEDIDYANRVVPVSYRLMDLATGNSISWPIRLIDENRNYIKVG